MKIKPLFQVFLIVMVLAFMAGCGSSSSTTPNEPKQQTPQQQAAPLVSSPDQTSTNQSTDKSNSTSTQATPTSSSNTSTQSSPSSQASPQVKTVAPAPAPSTNNQSMTVYIGATGSKYHYQSCRTLKDTKTPISIKDAKAQGRTACGVCDPPQ